MIKRFFDEQLAKWELARRNFDALEEVETRWFSLGGMDVEVMINPAREVSSGAKVDAKSIAERPCFLCGKNRPQEQMALPILPGYSLLVNPFPIFNGHFTIPSDSHQPQSILALEPDGSSRFQTLFRLAEQLPGYIVFYNGPKCGASAPDHLHFQAVPSENLPAIAKGAPLLFESFELVTDEIDRFSQGMLSYLEDLSLLPENLELEEPRVNVYAQAVEGGAVRAVIIPRRAHRPSFYGSQEGEMLISPGAIDVAGMLVCCRRADYAAIDSSLIRKIFDQTTYTI